MAQATYEVRVRGCLGPAAREAFSELEINTEPTATVLSGTLDQAALHGLIDRVRALGLELIDIKRVHEAHLCDSGPQYRATKSYPDSSTDEP